MKLLIIIVLYKTHYEKSISYNSIKKNISLINKHFKNIKLILYDNSPSPQLINDVDIDKYNIDYLQNKNNGGVSAAYNYAYQFAEINNFDWISFFDQDTEINQNYFFSLRYALDKINNDDQIVSIIPKIIHGNALFSPAHVKWGGIHRPVNINIVGKYEEGELMAIGSGMVLKTSFINLLGGFNKLFWLDCQDRWIFQSIYKSGKKCYILDCSLIHELSIMDFNKFMNPNKYLNQIYYESLFMLMYKTIAENIFYLIRLFRRAVYLYFKTKNFKYSINSLLIISKIIKSNFNFEIFKTSINPGKENV